MWQNSSTQFPTGVQHTISNRSTCFRTLRAPTQNGARQVVTDAAMTVATTLAGILYAKSVPILEMPRELMLTSRPRWPLVSSLLMVRPRHVFFPASCYLNYVFEIWCDKRPARGPVAHGRLPGGRAAVASCSCSRGWFFLFMESPGYKWLRLFCQDMQAKSVRTPTHATQLELEVPIHHDACRQHSAGGLLELERYWRSPGHWQSVHQHRVVLC